VSAPLQLPGTPIGKALRQLFEELARRIQPRSPLRIILAGGMAAHLYVGKRVTLAIDAEFCARVLIPQDLVVEAEGIGPLYFDTNYNPKFALMHEDCRADAILVDIDVPNIELRILAPVDLAVSKIARWADVDQEDIADLVRAGLATAAAIQQRAEAALIGYIGNLTDVRARIESAVELAAQVEAEPMKIPIAARQPSASAPFIRQPVRGTPEERIRRALELGRRGQLLRKLNPNARSKRDTDPR